MTNGNDLFTQFIDWSARTEDVLYVVAGNETGGSYGFNVPRDNYNGITVAATSLENGVDFRRVADYNRFNQPPSDGRRVVSLLAPGTDINMAALNEGNQTNSGTSFAAPHVVGTAALLQEYADRQIKDHGWSVFANSHQVMKAILLDSAEKLNLGDVPNATLRSDKDTLRTDGKTWLDSYPGSSRCTQSRWTIRWELVSLMPTELSMSLNKGSGDRLHQSTTRDGTSTRSPGKVH